MLIDNFLLVEEGRFREKETVALLTSGKLPGAQRAAEHRRPAGADRRQREGRAGAAPHGRALRPRRGARLHAPRAGQRRGIGAPRDRGAEGRRVRLPARQRRAHQGADHNRKRPEEPRRSTSRGTSPQLPNNFNAPAAVCMAAVLYVFRTLVDDDIPLNAGCLKPLEVIDPGGLHAAAALPGGGGGGQRRDLAVHHRRALRRARRARRLAGHDEQLHVRQRALPVLRDRRRRLGRRARASTAPTWCRRT